MKTVFLIYMPIKNSLKIYVLDGYYHLYNRGINKANIFLEKLDYNVFLSYLKTYLLPQDTSLILQALNRKTLSDKEKSNLLKLLSLRNYSDKVDLISYCLMPNHYHLLIRQRTDKGLEYFMRSFMTRYTKYFNSKHKRRGPLFEGRYKAVLVETDEQLVHLSRYIHRNPIAHLTKKDIENSKPNLYDAIYKQPSSYPVYLGMIEQKWIKPSVILDNFKSNSSYRSFVENYDSVRDEKNIRGIYDIAIDYDL